MFENFNLDNVMEALGIMGKGMLGIFVVTAVIVSIILILNKITNKK